MPGGFMPGRRCQISSHYIIPYSFCQVKRLFKFFSVNFSLHRQVCACVALASNFMRCQILINQLQTSYTSCQILKQLQNQLRKRFDIQFLYIYISPFIITQILILIKLQKLSNFYAQILNVSNFDF